LTWPALAPMGANTGPSCPNGCACHLDSYGRFSSYSLTRVDCSSSGLRDFPATLPLTTTHLSLVDNHLGPTVNPGGPGYTTLLALNLSHNGVKRAPLSTIDLSHNALSDEFDLSAFEADLPVIGVQRLSLDLSHNRISALKRKGGGGGGGAPAGTLHIRSLNLAANALMEAPPPELLRHLPDLQYLSLDSNPITRLRQSAFFHLRDLTHLSLRNLAPDVHFSRGTFRGLEGTLQVLDLSEN
uniref:LRRNT domain-containing protein n=1 Tax=Petromyzon marinus TaxID=7757 RepID=S4RI09_PETMA